MLPPSFNEADVCDKPSPVADLAAADPGPDLRHAAQASLRVGVAARASTGASATILDELKKDGERRNTYVFFASDNGFLRGEHRIRSQKRFIYEESSRVPFLVRGPGVARGEGSTDVVTNADVVPTILDLTGAAPGNPIDGVSLTENFHEPEARARPRDPPRGLRREHDPRAPDLALPLLRVGHGGFFPERELYDTYADPYELDNLAEDPAHAALVGQLSAELRQLEGCEGADCHTEDRRRCRSPAEVPGRTAARSSR